MLEPTHRSLLVDALRPPAGYRLDRAVGTTYSLDLYALLTPPLAFAQFDVVEDESGPPDVVALLEATRRHAEHMSIFCQAGKIAMPASYQPIFTNLEQSVHEVLAPRDGLFHPKLWLLRYLSVEKEPPQFRLLVLSRNLTYDRSWDTIVQLDGEFAEGRQGRAEARETNLRLADFIGRLPELAVRELPSDERQAIRDLAEQMLAVKFVPPEGFSQLRFWPMGLDGGQQPPVARGHTRGLIISPFLSDSLLRQIVSAGSEHILVSRSESLDKLESRTIEEFRGRVFVLNPSLSQLEEDRRNERLAGLHAKIYVLDYGRKSSVLTGSANATGAAFGQNVEFLVELEGSRSRVGVEEILGERGSDMGAPALISLFDLYRRPEKDEEGEPLEDQLRREAERLCAKVAGSRVRVAVTSLGDANEFAIRITSDRPVLESDSEAVLTCRPVTLAPGFASGVSLGRKLDLFLPRISFPAITSFLAFELTLSRDGVSVQIPFVVNADLVGAPEDRKARVLLSLLDNKVKVLRYLMFLMSDGSSRFEGTGILRGQPGGLLETTGGDPGIDSIPLLEGMLRILAQDPSRLDPIERLINDLSKTEEGRALLPDRIQEVWAPIWAARCEVAR